MDEYKIYDGEVYWRRDKYLVEITKLRFENIRAKLKGMTLRIQERCLKRKIKKLKGDTERLKRYEIKK